MASLKERLESLYSAIETELNVLQVEKKIRKRVKHQMEKTQREYYLNEQIKAIQKELGDVEEGSEILEYQKKIKKSGLPAEAREKAQNELTRHWVAW